MLSAAYKQQIEALHANDEHWGTSAVHHAEDVRKLIQAYGFESVLDYGCGKAKLYAALHDMNVSWQNFDPAIPMFSTPPSPADLVVCLDVLEHVEPEHIDAVLRDIVRCTRKCAYFVINTRPAKAVLPDGRNAHLIQEGRAWWTQKLSEHFSNLEISENSNRDIVVKAVV